jgi:hypothetical protein
MFVKSRSNRVSTTKHKQVIPIRAIATRLEDLYARKTVVESMIYALETYRRYRAKRVAVRKRRSA